MSKNKKDNRKSNEELVKNQMKTIDTELKNGVFVFSGPLTIGKFANAIDKSPSEIITHFFTQGKMFNINYTLNEEQIAELCMECEYDFTVETEINAQNFMDNIDLSSEGADDARAPIVTIMGHVDHGKTTLLDSLRDASVADSEAGGITQHTGAYQVTHNGKEITFLDTPGHEAFTAMRSRGAKVTDVVVIVVAANDSVMPQTVEAINHAKAAKTPIIIFVNKMDIHGVDAEKIKADLSKQDIVSEEWGGEVPFIYGSALKKEGLDKLLESIAFQAEMLELKADKNKLANGFVIESHLDKGKGVVATVIVEDGTLFKKDFIMAGSNYGKIRTMEDFKGSNIDEAFPGMPVVITGLNEVPEAGNKFFGFKDEKFAKKLAEDKRKADKQEQLRQRTAVTVKDGQKVLNIIIKSDVQGTAEAIKYSLEKIQNDEVVINIISATVGDINKSDILLAVASNSQIYGFNVNVSSQIISSAKQEGHEIKTFSIIYQLIEDVEDQVKGLMKPKFEEKIIGEANILKIFTYSKVGNIAGCKLEKGHFVTGASVRLFRKSKMIFEGKLDSLMRGRDEAKKVDNGKEFGCHIKGYDDIKEGDIIEAYVMEEIK